MTNPIPFSPRYLRKGERGYDKYRFVVFVPMNSGYIKRITYNPQKIDHRQHNDPLKRTYWEART